LRSKKEKQMKSSKNVLRLKGLGWLVAVVAGIGIGGITPASASAETNWLTEDVSKGIFSIGGRAMYFDPEDGKNHWFGGAQVRAHLGDIFAIEGSADYRKNDFGDTTVHTYPE
jgi:hypothetical protein